MHLPRIRPKERTSRKRTPSGAHLYHFEQLEPRLTLSANASPFPQITWGTEANGLPKLTSYAGAPAVIYLDYDGDAAQNISETDFADPITGQLTPGVFTPYEQQRIYEHWRGITDTFSMFNISVTTVLPLNPGANTEWIAITNDMITKGGFNGVNSFPDPEPSGQSGSDWWAEGYTHEILHGFGDNHQSSYDLLGNKLDEYAPTPVDDPLRAGVMGEGSGTIVKYQFGLSSGGVTSIQGDLEAVRSDVDGLDGSGDGYRPDDQTSTSKTGATALTVVDSTTQAVVGIIERMTDQDWYSFTSTGGTYNILVGRDNPSPVDVKLSIFGSDGTTLIATDDGDPMASATLGSASYKTMVNDSHLTLKLPAGTYYMKVESHGNYADLGKYIARVDRMIDGWQSEDIGLVYSPGFTDYDPTTGTFSVGGSGRGFGGTLAGGGDGGQIAYTKLVGDGEIIARVASIENVTKDIRAGLTFRDSLAPGSMFFSVYATPDMPGSSNDSRVAQQRRSTTDGNSSTQTASAAPSGPVWLRITRVGNVFTSYYSTNGTSWTQVSTTTPTIPMGAEAYVGLISTSANDLDRLTSNFLSTATFTNVKVVKQANIGTVGVAGTVNFNSSTNTYTLTGTGRGWGSIASPQEGSYVYYRNLSGDGSVTVRVASISSISATSGVFVRESLNTTSKYFAVWNKQNQGTIRSLRSATGGVSNESIATPTATWLRIVRTGDVFRSYASTDGNTWTQFGGDQVISMSSDVLIGLMVASGSTSATPVNTSTFDNLTFTGGIDVTQPLNNLAAPANVQVSSVTSTSASLSWTTPNVSVPGDFNHNGIVDSADFVLWRATGGSQADYDRWRGNFGAVQPVVTGFTIDRSSDNVNFQTIGTVAANILTYTDSTVAGGLKYFYRVRTNGAVGVSNPSAVASGITRAAAVMGLKVYSAATNQLVVQWNDVNGETDYTLERSTNGTSGWTTIGASTIAQNSTMYVNPTTFGSALNSGTQYFYRVTSVDGGSTPAVSAVVSGFTRLSSSSTPTVTVSARTTNSITLSWNSNPNLTRYAVYRGQDNSDWLWGLVNENITGTSFTDTGRSALSEYHYRVVGYNAAGAATQTVNIFGTTDGANPVTSPWLTQDIGSVAAPGATDLTSGTFTIVGGGADIWGTTDAFRYVYMPMSGDGFIQAHISEEKTPINDFSRAGIQIRETTATNSAQVSLMLHSTWASVRLQHRDSTGEQTGETNFPSLINPPYWLRLERVGDTITGLISPTGATGSWTVVGSASVTMGTNYLIGMALTPRDNNYLYWAKYDHVMTGALGAGAGTGAMFASNQSLLEMPTSTFVDAPFAVSASRFPESAFAQERRRALDDVFAQFELRQLSWQRRASLLNSPASIALQKAHDDENVSSDEETSLSPTHDHFGRRTLGGTDLASAWHAKLLRPHS